MRHIRITDVDTDEVLFTVRLDEPPTGGIALYGLRYSPERLVESLALLSSAQVLVRKALEGNAEWVKAERIREIHRLMHSDHRDSEWLDRLEAELAELEGRESASWAEDL